MNNHYFDADGVYIGSAAAHPVSLPPVNALRVAPPERPGHWPVLAASRDGWDLLEDHRGEKGWLEGRPAMMDHLGSLPPGWSDSPPPAESARDSIASSPTAVYCKSSGIYHASASCGGLNGEWIEPALLAERFPDARPCRRCGKPSMGGA